MKDCNAIILAAGKGTRMLSELPKCAYPFYGKPMIVYIINMCKKIQIDDICCGKRMSEKSSFEIKTEKDID